MQIEEKNRGGVKIKVESGKCEKNMEKM